MITRVCKVSPASIPDRQKENAGFSNDEKHRCTPLPSQRVISWAVQTSKLSRTYEGDI